MQVFQVHFKACPVKFNYLFTVSLFFFPSSFFYSVWAWRLPHVNIHVFGVHVARKKGNICESNTAQYNNFIDTPLVELFSDNT